MDVRQRLVELAPWHLDMPLQNGLRTIEGNASSYNDADFAGVQVVAPEEMRPVFARLFGDDLTGRSFLDVGCNAGGYCFLAKEMGAGRVLGFDVRDHWINQAKLVQQFGVSKGREDIEFRVCHLGDLGEADRFDITLFKGVFYHLPDPIHALITLCNLTNEVIIVDTATSSRVPERALLATMESTTKVMSGVDGLAWYPGGPAALNDILRHSGFPATETAYWRKETNPTLGHGRCRVIAARSAASLARYRQTAAPAKSVPQPA